MMNPQDFITEEIQQERDFNASESFQLGEYIYMAMGQVGDHRVCIGIGYKIGYCLKKAVQFIQVDDNVQFTHINKVRVGELEACQRFEING